jgi:hypothetical protein
VDVFLATTLLTVLENGARRVFPVASLEEAEGAKAKLDPSDVLRGGEQNSERIEGYDLGPFPEEYPPETVAIKDVLFITTNGTRVIADATPAGRVLLGCVRNAPAVACYLEASGAGLYLPHLRRRTLWPRRFLRRCRYPLLHEHRGLAPERRRVDGAGLHAAPPERGGGTATRTNG